jgi:hypothetical protein
MADPKTRLVITADGRRTAGIIHPSAGARLEISMRDSVTSALRIDYTDPDSLILGVESGDFTLRAHSLGELTVGGSLEKSLFDGRTRFHGALNWEFPKNVAVEFATDLGSEEKQAGAKITVVFR